MAVRNGSAWAESDRSYRPQFTVRDNSSGPPGDSVASQTRRIRPGGSGCASAATPASTAASSPSAPRSSGPPGTGSRFGLLQRQQRNRILPGRNPRIAILFRQNVLFVRFFGRFLRFDGAALDTRPLGAATFRPLFAFLFDEFGVKTRSFRTASSRSAALRNGRSRLFHFGPGRTLLPARFLLRE